MTHPSSSSGGPGLREALDELEERLCAFGAPIATAFRPGASRDQVRLQLVGEGLAPHDDLVTWWSWHDGAEVEAPRIEEGPGLYDCAENNLFGPWHVLSLVEAFRIRRWYLETNRAAGIEQVFPATWLPVLTAAGAGDLCADTSRPGPASLHIRDEGYFGQEPPKFDSLRELVECIVGVFAAGLVVPADHDSRVPSADLASLGPDQRRLVIW